ncbi:MAG: MFS transporter [Gemmatimonadetes bacterium]|nr:MFS transporter [Gemmatimonadota bacterium]MBT5145731.1 MFS transporter [Gemmatimonadota bacterium]MBT5588039.1 MFS transporter [Gemmatimonadota bacterium]MBT5960795.1 MFS transporter [Gemmatimonadota bacterium]MBT6628342.1 MFS transporter [Gemmatimonadota bacterium]
MHRLFLGLLIIGPVLTPYLRSKGFVYTEIMLLQSISAVSLVVFEMPTGIVADRVSRRLSLFLSGACIAAGLVVYILAARFATLAVGEVMISIGLTFRSGADAAFLHESLARLGREQEYRQIEGRAISWIFIGQSIGTFACSALYEWDKDLPFWLSVGAASLAAAVVLLFTEPQRDKADRPYISHVLHSFGVALGSPALRWTLVLVAIMGFTTRVGFWLYEPYFVAVEIPILWYGPIFGVFNIIAALSARFLAHRWGNAPLAMLFMLLLCGLTFLLPALFVSAWSITIISLQQIVRAAYKPTLGAWVNGHVTDDVRATMHSIFGSVAALAFSVVSPLIGLRLDGAGAIPTYALMGMGVCAAAVLLGLWLRLSRRWTRSG